MRLTGVTHGIEITTLADIPSTGSGLGSSSSITVALLHALYAYRNVLVTADRLAREACRIEIDILGKPIGRQDQYAAAFGGVNKLIFHADGTTERMPVAIQSSDKRKFASSLLLFYTGITRSADAILSQQKANFVQPEKRRTMDAMVALVDPFAEAMEKADIHACSRLLARNWELKQHMAAGISTPAIQAMYETALSAGALAGKVAGAGGGGFLLVVVPGKARTRYSKP